MANRLKETAHFTAPDGTEYSTDNLSRFAKEHGLTYNGVQKLNDYTIEHHKGWRNGHDRGVYEPKPPSVFTAPDGTTHVVTSISTLCKEYGLSYPSMCAIKQGVHRQHKGWRYGADLGVYDPMDNPDMHRKLTDAEVQVIRDNYKEFDSVELAEMLGRTPGTVRAYRLLIKKGEL